MKFIAAFSLTIISLSFVSCSVKENKVIDAKTLEKNADLFFERKEFTEANILYEILDDAYGIDVEEKLTKTKEEIEFDKNNISLDEVNVEFDYEKDLKYLKSIDPNYGEDYEINSTIVFREKGENINYDELLENSSLYLNKKIYNQGIVYKLLNRDEKITELIVNLGEKNNLKLVKVYCEFGEEENPFEVGNSVMFHGYYMGIHKESEDVIKKGEIPTVKSIMTTGLAG